MDLSRRVFLEMAAAAGAARLTSAAGMKDEKRPNIVLLLGDDHRADVMGCTGNSIVQTPQMDRLAREGVLFENHFCTTPICCASRASIMTGQYAGTTGIYDFATNLSPAQIRETYWMRLKQAGYHIGFIGKFGVGKDMPAGEFDYWKGFPGQGEYFPKGPSGPHLTDIMVDQTKEFIETAPRDKPFCLSISYKAPHVQDQSPSQYLPSPATLPLYVDETIAAPRGAGPEDIDRFPLAIQHSENRRRWGIRFATPGHLSSVDERLLPACQRDRPGDRFSSSRVGEAGPGLRTPSFCIRRTTESSMGSTGMAGKWYAHEECIRIPLIVYDPRLPANLRGKRMQDMTLNIDLQPTVLEMAGLKPSQSVQGRSLMDLLRGQRADPRHVWFIEHHFPDGGWIPSSEGIRTGRWKYIRYTDDAAPFEEIYDLQQDRLRPGILPARRSTQTSSACSVATAKGGETVCAPGLEIGHSRSQKKILRAMGSPEGKRRSRARSSESGLKGGAQPARESR